MISHRYSSCIYNYPPQEKELFRHLILEMNRFVELWHHKLLLIRRMNKKSNCPVGWGCRIHQLLLCREVRLPTNTCPGYNTKKSDGKVPVMLKLWGMLSTSSLPSLLGPLWARVVAPDKVLSIGQIELNCLLILNWIIWNRTVFDIETVLMLNWIAWNRTIYLYKNGFGIKWLTKVDMP